MKIETPILRRLGPVPFWRGSHKCLDQLQRIYNMAHDFAAEKLGYDPKSGRGGKSTTSAKKAQKAFRLPYYY